MGVMKIRGKRGNGNRGYRQPRVRQGAPEPCRVKPGRVGVGRCRGKKTAAQATPSADSVHRNTTEDPGDWNASPVIQESKTIHRAIRI